MHFYQINLRDHFLAAGAYHHGRRFSCHRRAHAHLFAAGPLDHIPWRCGPVYLSRELFVSLLQVLIYGGAICIVLVFGIMVGYTPRQIVETRIRSENLLLAVPTCGLGVALLFFAIRRTGWVPAAQRLTDYSIERVGHTLMYDFCLGFELISLLLLVGMIGAIIVSNSQEEESDGE